jgi:hypothetical protein
MKVTKTTREALKDKISQEGIHSVLRIGKRELTAKQRKFAEAVALGDTKVGAYRKAYDTKASKQQQGHQAHILSTHPKIAAQIEAFALANEAAKYRSSEGLRNLVIDSLTQIVLNPDAKDSVRVAAAKTLGTVVGVDAFRETKRIEHIQDSKAIRDKILGELKTITLNLDDALDVDATALLAELAGDDDDRPTDAEIQPETGDPHPAPTPQSQGEDSPPHTHTIPPKPSPIFSDSQDSGIAPTEHPPSSFRTDTPGGDIFLENENK